jgi:hypothetical protein
MINDSQIDKYLPIDLLDNFNCVSFEEFLFGEIRCSGCGAIIKKYTLFKGTFNATRRGVCNIQCDLLHKSNRMKGSGNSYHRLSQENKDSLHKKMSIKMKDLIALGKFTPEVTNSWARSRCLIEINGIVKKVRSSWEAYFYLANPSLQYEKLRIPYWHNNEQHSYIVDFVDYPNKKVYEIKPDSLRESLVNSIKEKSLIDWANANDFTYISIGEKWFIDNYDELLIVGQPDELKLKRLLKQFRIKL